MTSAACLQLEEAARLGTGVKLELKDGMDMHVSAKDDQHLCFFGSKALKL
jgi:hypothetical protein